MLKAFETLVVSQVTPEIVQLQLNRPALRNAINSKMMEELYDFWHSLYLHGNAIRCVILTGTPPAFCAGADLKERAQIDLSTWRKHRAVFEQAVLAMMDCPIPIIAAVNGAAFGGGLELTLACDFAYAASEATFSQSEVKIGLMPGAAGTQNLPRACGIRRAKELSFTGKTFTAEEALTWGIVNACYPQQALLKETIATAKAISANAPIAVRQTKKAINKSLDLDLKTGFLYELESYNQLLTTEDRAEGLKAFTEKRQAQFVGK